MVLLVLSNDNGQEKKKENTLSTKKVRFKKSNDNDQEKRRKETENAN